MLMCAWVRAQEIIILDTDSREPVMNVAVFNEDKSKTAISDIDGKVDLRLFSSQERITFRHIAYQTKKSLKSVILRQGRRVYLTMNAEQLDEVVMSVSKWEQQKRDVPQRIVSVDARTIAFSAPQTSADLLQQSGQVFVQKSQLGGGSPMIRGFATNRLLLSVDGVRMNNAIFRGGNIQNVISLDPFTISSTEVIFGPRSVIYGSDAIGGVMNFYTKKPAFAMADSVQVHGSAQYRFSSANMEQTGNVELNLGGKKWAALSIFSYSDFGDLRMGEHGPDSYLREQYQVRVNGRDYVVANPDPGIQVPTGYDQWSLMQKFAYKPNNYWQYDLGLHYSETSDYARYDRLVRPTSDGQGLKSGEWYYGPQRWFMGNFQATQKGQGAFYDGLKTTLAYQRFEESRYDRNFQDEILYQNLEQVDALSAQLDLENKKIGDLRLYYGAEYVYNKVGSSGYLENIETGEVENGPSRYPDGSTWQSAAAYLSGEYRARPNLTMMSGLRYSHIWLHSEFDRSFYPFPFEEANLGNGAVTGSLGLSWFPKEHLQLTFNTSTGFRSPNIDDVGKVFDSEPGSVVVPNPDLKPEYAYNVEMGIMKNFHDRLVLKGTAFYTYLDDALVRRDFSFDGQSEIEYNGELSNVQAIQNAANAYVYGFEFGMEAFLDEQFSLKSNLTITEGTEEEEDGSESASRHAAPTFGDLHLLWEVNSFKADLFLNYNGEIAFEDLSVSERSKDYLYASDADGNPYSPSWYTLNLRTRYQLNEAIRATLSLENITDQRYRSYSSGIVAPGRNLILSLGYAF